MKLDKTKIINGIEKAYLRKDIPNIEVGDTIRIGVLIQEGNKERVQFSEGVIIFQGIGVEKVYLTHSPRITNIKIIRKSKVKKAKLYYLRDKIGKATRLKQKFIV